MTDVSRRRIVPAVIGACLLGGTACGSGSEQIRSPGDTVLPDTVVPTFRAPASTPGQMVLVANVLRFRGCGRTGDGMPIRDLADGAGERMVREFGAPVDGITAIVRLDGERLVEIRYAGPERPKCDRFPPAGELEARGNEPFWHVQVRASEAWVYTPQEPGGVVYGGGRWSQSGGQWSYQARHELVTNESAITLEIVDGRCVDTMSGARFPWRARLIRDGNRMEGCALEGRDAQEAATPR